MSVLDEFSKRFDRPQSVWTKEQWRQAAIELASRLESSSLAPAKIGRPVHDDGAFVVAKNGDVTISAKSNYAALAWQVEQRLNKAKAEKRKLTIKDAIREELVATIQRHNAAKSDQRGKRSGELRESRADEMLETACKGVREAMKEIEKKRAEKKAKTDI
jgi:hypothetical protein